VKSDGGGARGRRLSGNNNGAVTYERFTEKGLYSVWAVIQSPPQLPVLADGLFPHHTPPAEMQTYEADIPLPNINCKKCTLQVVQFMANHGYNNPGGYSYHHCANLQITADPAKPIDAAGLPTKRRRPQKEEARRLVAARLARSPGPKNRTRPTYPKST